jgi:translation initiation factor IF-3
VRIDRKFRTRVNYQIRVPEVRVVDDEGEQLGVMETQKAIELAEEKGFDLVEVSPTARPPVCRIMDYGKYKYEKNKRAKQSKKKQHVVQVKEIKLRPKTEEHDFQFKRRHAEEFLSKHNKVKFTVIFRGRELDHKEMGMRLLRKMEEELSEVGVVERPAQFEGRLMTMYMAPHPHKPVQKKKEDTGKPEQPSETAAKPGPEETGDASGAAKAPEGGQGGSKEGNDAET